MIPPMKVRLNIGDFSRMTHLSVKALRHYHDIGLLVPVAVDPSSGYRQYDLDQVPIAQVIRRLRDLGMGLEDVKRVLEAPDVDRRNQAIVSHLHRMESELEQTKANVASLRSLLEGPRDTEFAIEVRSMPETHAIALQEEVTTAGLDAWWTDAYDELHAAAAHSRVQRSGPDGALYSSAWFEDEVGDVVAFVPITDAPRLRAGMRVREFVVPAAELAVLVHRGPLRDIDQTYAALGRFVSERAIGVEGPMREYYIVSAFETQDELTHRTEVAWPIFQTSAR
jgi:DNA-binding transcriptional MerR regulator